MFAGHLLDSFRTSLARQRREEIDSQHCFASTDGFVGVALVLNFLGGRSLRIVVALVGFSC